MDWIWKVIFLNGPGVVLLKWLLFLYSRNTVGAGYLHDDILPLVHGSQLNTSTLSITADRKLLNMNRYHRKLLVTVQHLIQLITTLLNAWYGSSQYIAGRYSKRNRSKSIFCLNTLHRYTPYLRILSRTIFPHSHIKHYLRMSFYIS